VGALRAQWIIVAIVAASITGGCSRQESRWKDAARTDTVAGYEEYLARFPAGAHAVAARERILELREEQDWARADRLRTPEAWQRHLADWPEGRHAAEARDRLARFVPLDGGGRDWSVQLGAFSDEAAAQSAQARLADALAAAPGGISLRILAPQEDPADVWRLRTGPLPEAAARELCARLRTEGVDCVPVAD
jgi:hypothetical protein